MSLLLQIGLYDNKKPICILHIYYMILGPFWCQRDISWIRFKVDETKQISAEIAQISPENSELSTPWKTVTKGSWPTSNSRTRPLMRDTLNELALKDSNGKPLPVLEKGSIIFPPHAIAFAHAFGFSFDEYTHKNDSEGMPIEELKPVIVGLGLKIVGFAAI
ncbi:hypothetical protein Lnau_2667 [Legionella nautarum]|uniref:Uncharacterized protein n=1 Tax=Legionella nautarum TaxID=45070 RepID=A0A0W0WL11_9GAMM|nr:hypothetical protein [Legionella nautarum]KTD33019.1 hypothetical protein Lnau_2667 [Legionella nautarum]